MNGKKIVFGPVPSRRLGQSLGINNIPPKVCSYSCVYCQIGKTLKMEIEREEFYKVEEIVKEVEETVEILTKRGEKIDYLSFVPDGEPTLDKNLGQEIRELKKTGIKIAVITNSSLLWKEDVREDLKEADWVSVKIDAVSENLWRKINRPFRKLNLSEILKGIENFSSEFQGFLASETMLVEGINDTEVEIEKIASFIKNIKIEKSYISIPTRPPSEKWVFPPSPEKLNMAYQIFRNSKIEVEFLTGYGGVDFGFTGNLENDILRITSVHPMRADQVEELVKKANGKWKDIEKLVEEEKLVKINYRNQTYYLRKFR
ncbi:radical SAM protein [bacterium]|nr:radical SAM protein [bacterium]